MKQTNFFALPHILHHKTDRIIKQSFEHQFHFYKFFVAKMIDPQNFLRREFKLLAVSTKC